MKPETVSLLCTPGTHEPLQLISVKEHDGSVQEVLVGIHSGERYLVGEGIPLLLDERKSPDSTSSIKGSTTG